jgi:hypothetical protein
MSLLGGSQNEVFYWYLSFNSVTTMSDSLPIEHPSEDAIEEYVAEVRLDTQTRAAISAHLLLCEHCRETCAEAELFVGAMRAVLSRKRLTAGA